MIRKLSSIIFIILIFAVNIFSIELKFFPENLRPRLTGRLRNDYFLIKYPNEYSHNDIIEGRLLITKRHEDWRFYTDLRGYVYWGDLGKFSDEEIKLLRSYLRIYSKHGDFTLGKNYINFGNISVFNVFELRKQINITDLDYDKEGLLSLSYDLPFGFMSGLRAYISPEDEAEGGISLFTNYKRFDLGWVYNRKDSDKNISGIYFKGDIEVGIHGSYGYHFDDEFKNGFHEAGLGIDYSYKKLFFGTSFYYNELGARNKYEYFPGAVPNTYFIARFYNYTQVLCSWDEFISFGLKNFNNTVDGSGVAILFFDYVIRNNLYLNIQTALINGDSGDEYSSGTAGDYNLLLRLEYKF